MDCGENLLSHGDHENSVNGSILTTDKLTLSLQMPADSNTDRGNVPTNAGDKMEYMTPTGNVQVTLFHLSSCEMLTEMQNSTHSIASSNSSGYNGTFGTIDSNYPLQSTFKMKNGSSNNEAKDLALSTPSTEDLAPRLKSAMQSPTQAPNIEHELQQHRESISCGIEESTEVLLVNSSECDEKYFGSSRAYSGTDSDVEVLMSEEIVDSDWSAGGTATDEMAQTPDEPAGAVAEAKVSHLILEIKKCQQHNKMTSSETVKEESTDQEISVEDFSSNSANELPSKDQLLKIISEQATNIQKLESTIERYRRTHQTLLKHVEMLRLALNETDLEANDLGKLGSHVVINQK